MYAYCNNNPINMIDSSGALPELLEAAIRTVSSARTKINAVLNIPYTGTKILAASTISVVSGQASFKDVWNDIKNYRFFNKDETKVLNFKVFSSYNGTPVIRHNISIITSFSFSNTIILNKTETEDREGIDTVKHEWGHTVQESLIGTPKYFARFGMPSMLSCLTINSHKVYFSLPWERTADFFGGANRSTGYYDGSGIIAGVYLILP